MHTSALKLTIEDYELLPDDGKRYELLEGEIVMSPAPSTRHQRISRRIQMIMQNWLDARGEGGEVLSAPVDVVFDVYTVAQPDLVYVSSGRASIVGAKNIQGAPDLVVEILSESTRRQDLVRKRHIYGNFAVPGYWIVDPDADRIEVYDLRAGVYERQGLYESPTTMPVKELPGLTIELTKIFA